MQKIIESIKKRPLNIILMITAVILYQLNNYYFKPYKEFFLHDFFTSYFNDLICPFFFLGYTNLLLISNNKEVTSLKILLIICLSAGCIWEFVAPFFKKESVTDTYDLICYAIGTLGYWMLLKRAKKGIV